MSIAEPADQAEEVGGPAQLGWHRRPGARVRDFARRLSVFQIVTYAIVGLLTGLAIYPLAKVLLRLFYADGSLELKGIKAAFNLPDLGRVLTHTAIVTFGAGFIALIAGSLMAWLNERTDARAGVASDVLPLVPFLIPPIAGALGWMFLLAPRTGYINAAIRSVLNDLGYRDSTWREGPFNIYSWWGMISIFALYAIPYIYMLVAAGLRNADPALEEQSRVCGAGILRTIWKVTLPSIRPSLGAGSLLMLWFGVSFLSVPIILQTRAGIDVLSVRIVRLLTFRFPADTDTAVGLSLFVVAVVAPAWYLQQRLLRKGRHATVGGRGRRVSRIALGVWKWPGRMFTAGYVVVAGVMPLGALALVSVQGFWTPKIDWGNLDLDTFRTALFEDTITRDSLRNSVVLGIVAATLGVLAAAMIALYVQRTGGRQARIIDGLVKLPAAFSSLVVAIGFILAFAGPPFNLHGTFIILILAFFALYMPQASVAADAAASQLGKDLTEASELSGAGGGRTFFRISLPVILPGLIAAWTLLFVRMVGDLTASALLAGPTNSVVGLRILQVVEYGDFALLAALALMMTLITTGTLALVFMASRRWRKFELVGTTGTG